MKLRIRSLESKETHKIETPNSSSLQTLKDIISNNTSIPSQTLHLSLNRKDEIVASPTECLTSLGIASGDLIYYTPNPNGFSSESPIQVPVPQIANLPVQVSNPKETQEISNISDMGIQELGQRDDQTLLSDKSVEVEETLISEEGVEGTLLSDEAVENIVTLSSVPSLLQKVYKEEMGHGNIAGNQSYKLLIVAVHAVFIESGFVCFDGVSKKKIDGFCLPEGWCLKSTVGVQYTLPALVDDRREGVEVVDLKFQTLGKFVCVHGSLSNGNRVGFFRLDAARFVPSINFVCGEDCDSAVGNGKEEVGKNAKSSHEKEVFELWKIAKDGLALPLLIDLCEKTGLEPPPCFMCLPTDLKLKILEFISGIDLARVACVSREMQYLSSNNDLWKQKYLEEFPQSEFGEISKDHWKDKYVISRERRCRKRRPYLTPFLAAPHQYPPMRRFPRPFSGFPGIIGGDQDRFPAPFGSNQLLRFPGRRNFTPHCDLTGFGDA